MQDMRRKQRHSFGIRSGMAKLNETQIVVIRKRRAKGEGIVSISKAFGISSPNVSYIANRKNWKHIA